MIRYSAASRERGSVLATTIVLCVIAATASLWMVQTLRDHQKLNIRRRDVERSYFAAEAGVAQVLQWGTTPGDYDSNGSSGLFYLNPTVTGIPTLSDFPNLNTALSADGEYALDPSKLGDFSSKYSYSISKVKELALLKPAVSDPVSCLFKVRSVGSVGESQGGVQRQVVAYLVPNPIAVEEIVLPAALISLGTGGQSGNGKVHWGEAWSKENFEILNKSMYDYVVLTNPYYDQWAKYRTEQKLIFANNWKSGIGQDIYQEDIRRLPGAAPATGSYAGGLEQLIPPGTLQWPNFASLYQTFKGMALSHGRYYTTDAAGNIYRGPVRDLAHKIDFNNEFGNANRETSPYDLVFIDTIDGQPPVANGSNLATISNSGTGTGMKGVFYVCANYKQTGSGSSPSLTCERPDGTPISIANVYLDGVFYSAGLMNVGGNPIVYGSVVAEKGFASGGTPEVYYNYKLKDGLELPKGNLGSMFKIVLQKNEGVEY